MITDCITPQRRFYRRLHVFFYCFSLAGCLPDDIVKPEIIEREPLIPSLACKPFVENGYTEKVSYYPGEKMRVFLETRDRSERCRLTVFSVNGDSVLSVASELPEMPDIPKDASERGYDLRVAVEINVPSMASGIYLIEKKIPFIVKTHDPVDVMVVYPSNTANAYAESGGKSLYSKEDRPVAVSFQRPIPLQSLSEYCLKWFSTLEDFSVGYVADVDVDYYERINRAKVLVLAGHSEYWTRQARLNFDRFVDSGGHALILSGNTMWWQVRYSEDQTKMFCYRDATADPVSDPLLKTIEWDKPSLQYPIVSSIGADFPRGGYGMKSDNGWNGYKIATPSSPLFEGLGLKRGDILSLPSLEYDGAPIVGFDPEGYPILDKESLNFEKIELLAFDKGYRARETTATFIVFQRTKEGGMIINTASTDWCSSSGMGGKSANAIKRITYNALHKLVNGVRVFRE